MALGTSYAWIVAAIFTAVITYVLIRTLKAYAKPSSQKWLLVIVGTSWWLGACSLIVLLPLDLASAVARSVNGTIKGIDGAGMEHAWAWTYWVTFILAWVVCPVAMEYHAAGDFTPKDKLKTALKSNIKFYIACAVVIVVVVILILLAGVSIVELPSFTIAAVNFYGLVLIVVMLGYGLVKIPRNLWMRGSTESRLNEVFYQAPRKHESLLDARFEMEDAIGQLVSFQAKVASAGPNADREDILRHLDSVMAVIPSQFKLTGSVDSDRKRYARAMSDEQRDDARPPTISTLASAHKRLKWCKNVLARAEYDWNRLLQEADDMQRSVDSGCSEERTSRSRILRISLSIACIFLSSMLLWSECMVPFGSKLSTFGAILRGLANGENIPMLQLFATLWISYMTLCCYVALFKFRLLDGLSLYPDKQSDAYNLLYNASYLCRLQFSLGYNFIAMIISSENTLTAKTTFSRFLGEMDVVPFFGKGVNDWMPVFIAVVACIAYFNALDRMLGFLRLQTNPGAPTEGDIHHSEIIAEGKSLVAKAKRKIGGGAGGSYESSDGASENDPSSYLTRI